RAVTPLLHENHFPVVEAQTKHVAIVTEVEEEVTRALLGLAGQVGQEIESVDVVLVGPADRPVASLQLVDDIRSTCHGEESRQPVVMLHDPVGGRASGDLPRPTYEER